MSRITGPLLSFGASGAIAKTQVYSVWKGRPYVRRYVVPANPQSTEQTKTRSVFGWLMNVWKFAPADIIAAYNLYASGLQITGRNALAKANIHAMRGDEDLSGFLFSPGAKSGLAAAGIAVAPADSTLTVTLTAPTLPTGWTIVKAIAAAIKGQNPQIATDYIITEATDENEPYAPVISGLTNGTLYNVGGWFEYTKADGSTAIGPSSLATGTPA